MAEAGKTDLVFVKTTSDLGDIQVPIAYVGADTDHRRRSPGV